MVHPAAAGDAEIPQVEVRCGVVYSLTAMPNYSSWASAVPSAMGSSAWSHILLLTYAPFVVVKNNTGWPLVLNGGAATNPQVSFDQPALGLRFQRIGNDHAGFVTTSAVPLDRMYVSTPTAPKTFTLTLYGAGSPPAGFKTLDAGATQVFSAYLPASTNFNTSQILDWQNNLTTNITAGPGWTSPAAGYCVDYLVGNAYRDSAVNSTLVVCPTRPQDSWDVEVSTTGALNGCRVFHNTSPLPANWPWEPDVSSEVTTLPFKLTDYQTAIPASTMSATGSLSIYSWPLKPLFSVLLSPRTLTGFVTDRNNNGITDAWEKHYFGALSSNGALDPDKDGFSNYFEFLAGTSPVNGADFITQKFEDRPGGGLNFRWSSVVNRSYVVETSSNLSDWSAASETITATGTECLHPISQPASGRIFARLRILPVK
jgi:hypothetical protein